MSQPEDGVDLARVQRTWRRRVAAEYTSAAISAELLHQLLVLGVSPDVLDLCHRIVGDEMAHAELSREVYLEAGGAPESVALARTGLSSARERGAPLEERVLATVADVFCCGETVAVPLFLRIREQTSVPVAKRALDRIVRDESVHRQFGWMALDALLETLGDDARRWLSERAPAYMTRIHGVYVADGPEYDARETAWGLMSAAAFSEEAERCLREVIRPRFEARLGPLPAATGPTPTL